MSLPFDSATAKQFLDILIDGDASTVQFDFRAIHDQDKGRPGQPMRGTLAQVSGGIQYWTDQGYGVFVVINELDGIGREYANVIGIRAAFVDLDRGDIPANYKRAMEWEIRPVMSVVSSPGRAHIYWRVRKYLDVPRFENIQRRLVTLFDGDPTIIDAPRVMRLPGSWHQKTAQPSQVALYPNVMGGTVEAGALEWALAAVAPSEGGGGERIELGDDPALAAPSLAWATYALNKVEPGDLDRDAWLKLTAAFKASAWAWGEPVARLCWDLWCAQYPKNDLGENEKLWRSIVKTKAGWPHLKKTAGIEAELLFGSPGSRVTPAAGAASVPPLPGTATAPADTTGWMLTPGEQAEYFDGCYFVTRLGRILTPARQYLDANKFNGFYGGKMFIIDSQGKVTDEPWKAATRGQVFRVPKVNDIRFQPEFPYGHVSVNDVGRTMVNTYKQPNIPMEAGDVTPWLDHIRRMLPTERDLQILLSFLAHNVQRPGRKAFWAPLIQSEQGAGKNLVKIAMRYALGESYVYEPRADQLLESGGKFTGWMRERLMIIADEIKVDEKRDMVEMLKPMISEDRIEVQSKGVDQEMEDNRANWVMFTNYKDAIPITSNDRRYAIMYSNMQSGSDILAEFGGGDYFPRLYAWLNSDGKRYVAHYLANYQIQAEFDPAGVAHRAPLTSSHGEAVIASRGRAEQVLIEAIETNATGFRGGWLSSARAQILMRDENIKIGHQALGKIYELMGYKFIGRANRQFFEEETKQPNLYNLNKNALITDYPGKQGYR